MTNKIKQTELNKEASLTQQYMRNTREIGLTEKRDAINTIITGTEKKKTVHKINSRQLMIDRTWTRVQRKHKMLGQKTQDHTWKKHGK